MSKLVHRVVGIQGVLEVYENKVEIMPKRCLAFLSFGFKGAKSIPFSSITAIELKKAGMMTNGYIQFTLPGGNESRGGVFAATKDENSFMFKGGANNKRVVEIKGFIEERMGPSRQLAAPATVSPSSAADEIAKLAKLRDQGILSEEEFASAKAKLL